MDLSKFLYVGKRVYVVREKNVYLTNIQDIKEGSAVMLAVPISRGAPVYIADGTSIEVGFWESSGIYSYKAVVIKSVWVNSLRMYLVEPCSKLAKLQRRDNYRLPVSCKVDVQIMDEDRNEPVEKLSTCSLNISMGGICIKLPRVLAKGTQLICNIDLGENGSVNALGQVVHHMHTNAVDDTYAMGVAFTQCSPAELRRLARFMRAQELRRRRLQ